MDLDRKRFISSLVKSAHYHLSAQARFLGSLEEIMMDELTLLTPTAMMIIPSLSNCNRVDL